MNMVAHPSSFVLFSDVRNRSAETPFYPMAIANQFVLATPHCYTTRFSSRHGQGGLITFSDGHAAYYKYGYVVSDGTAVSPLVRRLADRSPPVTTPAVPNQLGLRGVSSH